MRKFAILRTLAAKLAPFQLAYSEFVKSFQKISTNIGLHDFQLETTRCRFHVFSPPATSQQLWKIRPTKKEAGSFNEQKTRVTFESLLTTNKYSHDYPNFSCTIF